MLNNQSTQTTIYPFIHDLNNFKSKKDIYQGVLIPDINLEDKCKNSMGTFSIIAGDFITTYQNRKNSFHCVVTCFFLDTSHYVLDYIDLIFNLLHDGGFWVNLGPLTYHYSESPGEISIELSWEEVMEFVKQRGFEVIRETFLEAEYCKHPNKMKNIVYDCGFFAARKI